MFEKNEKFVNLSDVLANKTDIEVVIEAVKRVGIWITGVNPIFSWSEPSLKPVKYRGMNQATSKRDSLETEYLISLLELYKRDVIENCDPDDKHIQFVKTYFEKTTYSLQEIDIANEFERIEKEKKPPLITINNLLYGYQRKKRLSYSDIARQIKHNGIYVYEKFPSFLKVSVGSSHCATALTGLSAYYDAFNRERGEYQPYQDDPDADPTYLYGWPETEFSKFIGPNDETYVEDLDIFHRLESNVQTLFFKKNLYTLGRILLLTETSPAMVASAIEKYGIYGYDKFGRVEYHSASSINNGIDYLKVREPLTRYASSIIKYGVIDLKALKDEAFLMFGWPAEHLPDFNEFNGKQPNINAPQIVANSSEPQVENSIFIEPEKAEKISAVTEDLYIKTIAGLLWYIQGKTTANEHPDGSSQNKLIKNLIEALPRLPGANNSGHYKRLFAKVNVLRDLMRTPAEVQEALLQAEKDSDQDT